MRKLEVKKLYGHGTSANQGQLWTGLLDFNQTIRDLYEGELKAKPGHALAQRYYENVVKMNPPGFARTLVTGPVTVLPWKYTECKDLNLAAVIPGIFRSGEKSVIISKSCVSGELEIALYSRDGKEKIKTLFQGQVGGGMDGHAGFYIYEWEGKDPDTHAPYVGDYTVRWTCGPGYREFPITVK
jgi:hypothetical protein